MTSAWISSALACAAITHLHKLFQQLRFSSHHAPFWDFYRRWKHRAGNIMLNFSNGDYQPRPMCGYNYRGEITPYWTYDDKIQQKILRKIIKPTFKYIISDRCLHLVGPSQIKKATAQIDSALRTNHYYYVIRTDIKSYYASINHQILKKQVQETFADTRVVNYLHRIIEVTIDRGGILETLQQGIPVHSSLSGFFAALYLKPLDQRFAPCSELFYIRYNDDIIILCKSKSQFAKAKRRLKYCLQQLKLKIAPKKTHMGRINKGFHFLGINFSATQIQRNSEKRNVVRITLHPRTYHRARENIKRMQEGLVIDPSAGTPADVQRYISRWARWWRGQHQSVVVEPSLLGVNYL